MAHGRIKHTPRWVYNDVVLPPSSDSTTRGVVEIEPTKFVNDTIWMWELEHFTFFAPQSATNYGGTATNIEVRLGMSGQSDLNLVDGPLSILAGNTNMQALHGRFIVDNDMLRHEFKYPYRLSKDNGLRVRVQQTDARWGFYAYGIGVDSGKPHTLLARSGDLSASGEEELYSADLMNSGVEDVDIHRIGFDDVYDGYTGDTAYMVNPITGVLWMPGESEITARLLGPYTANAAVANGDNALNKPQSVQFPEGTKLRRRQRLRVRLRNVDSTNNILVRMALFGYLEVK